MTHKVSQSSCFAILSILLCCLMMTGIGCGEGSQSTTLTPAPAITWKGLDGQAVSLASFKGKVVIVDFWATWCGPCKVSIPDLNSLYNKYRDQGVEVIGVTIKSGAPEEIQAFADAQQMRYTLVLGDGDSDEAFGRVMSPPRARVSSLPTTFMIDRTGNVYKSYIGYRPNVSREELEADIKKLL